MRGQPFWQTMLLLTLKRQDCFVNIFLVVEKLINVGLDSETRNEVGTGNEIFSKSEPELQ
jgi:hypothetical protein